MSAPCSLPDLPRHVLGQRYPFGAQTRQGRIGFFSSIIIYLHLGAGSTRSVQLYDQCNSREETSGT